MTEARNKERKSFPMQSEAEIDFLERIKKFQGQYIMAHENSKQEGFEFLFSEMGKPNLKMTSLSRIRQMGSGLGIMGKIKLFGTFIKYMKPMQKGMKECFTDLEPYFMELTQSGELSSSPSNIVQSYPNRELWIQLEEYANDSWNIAKIGFTELPEHLIFKDKAVFFRYALVFIQEMEKDKIDLAPDLSAGQEVMRVYKTLGIAVNDIARWLRSKEIRCQSNHPMGGLVNTPPLAGKAGMGWQGQNGLLITPEFGQRQRIAPIFIQDKIFEFTDNDEHRWIEEYCKICGRCKRECPTQAIWDERKISIDNVPGISATRTCIDRSACFPYFLKTMGCSVCVKVCPFSKGSGKYFKLKMVVNRKK